jgi:hypothetical protein
MSAAVLLAGLVAATPEPIAAETAIVAVATTNVSLAGLR